LDYERQGKVVLHSQGHVLVHNPKHKTDKTTTLYAAIRMVNTLSNKQQTTLCTLISMVNSTAPTTTTSSEQGNNFHMRIFGAWFRFSNLPSITKERMHKDSAEATVNLLAYLDASLDKTSTLLQHFDPTAALSMRHHHHKVDRYLRKAALLSATTFLAKEENQNTSTLRIGGLGTSLAVSHGEGTLYHYDNDHYPAHYTVIFVLGRGATLHLPEVGRGFHLKPGDSIAFSASQQMHKIEADPPD
ncbi:hypothetical protein EJ02DRAFT_296184, partial [Clathrospora elynae]